MMELILDEVGSLNSTGVDLYIDQKLGKGFKN